MCELKKLVLEVFVLGNDMLVKLEYYNMWMLIILSLKMELLILHFFESQNKWFNNSYFNDSLKDLFSDYDDYIIESTSFRAII